jgi:hypothetical protein
VSTESEVLAELLGGARDDCLERAVAALGRRGLPHYPNEEPERNRERLAALLDAAVESLARRELAPIVRHARAIAGARARLGFGFHEVHAAFNVLEETLWQLVVERLPPERLPEALGLVATVLGAGKEALAAEYVALADPQARFEKLDLSALFRGTA